MKNSITLICILLFCKGIATAQNSTGTAVAVGSSYVNNVEITVYPYNGSGNSNIDKRIHFKLRRGTKFYIDSVLTANSTLVGYYITPWRFPDSAKENGKMVAKAVFYKKLKETKATYYKQLFLANAAVKQADANLKSDSLYVDTAKRDLDQSKMIMKKAVDTLVKITPLSSGKKSGAVKPQVSEFADAQAKLITSLSKSKSLTDTTKAINTALATMKTVPASAEKIKTKTVVARSQTDTAVSNLKTALDDYNASKSYLEAIKAEFAKLKASFYKVTLSQDDNGQKSNDEDNDRFYKKTKYDINNAGLDKVTDTTSLASMYDDLAYVDSWANNWEFAITANDFSYPNNCVPFYPHSNQFTWGFLTLPLKLRFDNGNPGGRFNFEQNLNFGLTFGDKMQIKSRDNISVNFLAGISVVSVQLYNADATTTATTATTTTTSTQNLASTTAISMSLGSMFQYDKFQIGLFLGRDYAGTNASMFPYQHKLWIGFAIGVSLFGEGKTTATSQTQ